MIRFFALLLFSLSLVACDNTQSSSTSSADAKPVSSSLSVEPVKRAPKADSVKPESSSFQDNYTKPPKLTASQKLSLSQAEQKLKQTFKNVNDVVSFQPSPISGLYELNTNNKIVYYYPEKDYLIFGEIYDSSGSSLTQLSISNTAKKNLEKIDRSIALKIGDGDIDIVEVLDPDCPYCSKYKDWIKQPQNASAFTRYILFENRIHPQSTKKIVHILCSSKEEQEKEFDLVMSNSVTEYQSCQSGEYLLSRHIDSISMLGVSGTPSFLIEGALINGFDENRLNEIVRNNTKSKP